MSDEKNVASVILCGLAPSTYDVKLKSQNGKCPHCGATDALHEGYGLGPGGFGSYSICEVCSRFCDSVQDEE